MEIKNKNDILKFASFNLLDTRCKLPQIKKSILKKEEYLFIKDISLKRITTNSRISDEFIITTNGSVIHLTRFLVNFINKNKNRSKYQIFVRFENQNFSTNIEASICNETKLIKLFDKIDHSICKTNICIENVVFHVKFYKPKNYRSKNDMDVDI